VRTSDDLEAVLGRFRPGDPPPDLRTRVVGGRGFRGRRSAGGRESGNFALIEWLPAVAALLLVVLFHWLAGIQQLNLAAHFAPEPSISAADDLRDFVHD
jgi:hypothetical protein